MPSDPNFPANSKIPPGDITRATRHLFLCLGPDCCEPEKHAPLWDLLKAESKRLKVPILRTKAACLRICKEGPWLVVYPDGIWYGRMDADRLRRILTEHVEEGRPVEEWVVGRMPELVGGAGRGEKRLDMGKIRS